MLKMQEKILSKNKLLIGLLVFSLLLAVVVMMFPIAVQANHTTEHTIEQLYEQIKALQSQIQTANAVATSTALYTFTKMLSFSSRGEEVSQLQIALKADPAVYPEGLVTGYFGALTQSAVKRFQEKYQISSIGIVGPKTRAKLNELYGGAGETKNFSLKIISPNGGERIAINDTSEISWSLSPTPPLTYTLILSLFDGLTPGFVASPRPIPESGKYVWKVSPSITQGDMVFMLQSGSYRLKASLYDGAPCLGLCPPTTMPQPKILNEDISDAPFMVTKQATSTNY